MATQSEIQVWNTFGPIAITPDVLGNRFRIEVEESAKPLPENLEERVNNHWKQAVQKNPRLYDDPILYLASPLTEDKASGLTSVKANIRVFRYTHAFNRNPDFHNLTNELNRYGLLSFSTSCFLVTKDNKALFGTKRNQFNQISDFSGFPNLKEDPVAVTAGRRCLDIYVMLLHRLAPEIGSTTGSINSIEAIGLTYVNTQGLRGTDSDYLAYLDETAGNAQRQFKESYQFERQLFAVDFEPAKLLDFFAQVYSQGREMSKYALGCTYSVVRTHFGQKEGEKLLQLVRNQGITISTSNETGYFERK